MTGSASFGDISVDLNGEIIKVEAPESESQIVSSRLLPFGGLELTSRGEDPGDTITVCVEAYRCENWFCPIQGRTREHTADQTDRRAENKAQNRTLSSENTFTLIYSCRHPWFRLQPCRSLVSPLDFFR